MSKVLVATRNRGKQQEFRNLLAALPWTIVFPGDIGLAASAGEDALEIHDTFEANARAKARWFAHASGMPALADDSGLEVDALGSAPGVLSRRFAGIDGPDHVVSDANNVELLRRLDGVPSADRSARFRCVLVFAATDAAGNHTECVARGTVEGNVVRAPRGSGGFGYDPLFYCNDLGSTFGEASAESKQLASHRARAVDDLRGKLFRG